MKPNHINSSLLVSDFYGSPEEESELFLFLENPIFFKVFSSVKTSEKKKFCQIFFFFTF